jgi:titin
VAWTDNSTDESGFKVERSANGADFAEIASLGAGTIGFTESGIAARVTYWYRVRAFNGFGPSDYSNTASLTMPDVAPAPPAGVAALNNGDGSASVNWVDASDNETGFEARREAWDSRRGVWKDAMTVGSLPAGVTGLVDVTGNGTFRYTVRALGSVGASGYAGPALVSVTGGAKGGGKGRTR